MNFELQKRIYFLHLSINLCLQVAHLRAKTTSFVNAKTKAAVGKLRVTGPGSGGPWAFGHPGRKVSGPDCTRVRESASRYSTRTTPRSGRGRAAPAQCKRSVTRPGGAHAGRGAGPGWCWAGPRGGFGIFGASQLRARSRAVPFPGERSAWASEAVDRGPLPA